MPVRIIYASLFHPPFHLPKQHASVFSCHNELSCLMHCMGTVCLPALYVCACVCVFCCVDAAYALTVCECMVVYVYECLCKIHTYIRELTPYMCACLCPSAFILYFFRASHTERDVNMKRQLLEDLKTRLKVLQEMEKSYRGQVEDLEKKVDIL